MVVLKRLTAQLATGLLVAGAVAQSNPQTTTGTTSFAAAETDIAASFVAELIRNATQIQQQLEGGSSENKKRGLCAQPSNLTVNLGYAKYQGSADTSTGINSWKGFVLPSFFSIFYLFSSMHSQSPDGLCAMFLVFFPSLTSRRIGFAMLLLPQVTGDGSLRSLPLRLSTLP